MITLNTEYRDFTGNLFVVLLIKKDFAREKGKLHQMGGGGGLVGCIASIEKGRGVDIAFYKVVWQIWSLFEPR